MDIFHVNVGPEDGKSDKKKDLIWTVGWLTKKLSLISSEYNYPRLSSSQTWDTTWAVVRRTWVQTFSSGVLIATTSRRHFFSSFLPIAWKLHSSNSKVWNNQISFNIHLDNYFCLLWFLESLFYFFVLETISQIGGGNENKFVWIAVFIRFLKIILKAKNNNESNNNKNSNDNNNNDKIIILITIT